MQPRSEAAEERCVGLYGLWSGHRYSPEDSKGSFKKTKTYCMLTLKERGCCGGVWHRLIE